MIKWFRDLTYVVPVVILVIALVTELFGSFMKRHIHKDLKRDYDKVIIIDVVFHLIAPFFHYSETGYPKAFLILTAAPEGEHRNNTIFTFFSSAYPMPYGRWLGAWVIGISLIAVCIALAIRYNKIHRIWTSFAMLSIMIKDYVLTIIFAAIAGDPASFPKEVDGRVVAVPYFHTMTIFYVIHLIFVIVVTLMVLVHFTQDYQMEEIERQITPELYPLATD